MTFSFIQYTSDVNMVRTAKDWIYQRKCDNQKETVFPLTSEELLKELLKQNLSFSFKYVIDQQTSQTVKPLRQYL